MPQQGAATARNARIAVFNGSVSGSEAAASHGGGRQAELVELPHVLPQTDPLVKPDVDTGRTFRKELPRHRSATPRFSKQCSDRARTWSPLADAHRRRKPPLTSQSSVGVEGLEPPLPPCKRQTDRSRLTHETPTVVLLGLYDTRSHTCDWCGAEFLGRFLGGCRANQRPARAYGSVCTSRAALRRSRHLLCGRSRTTRVETTPHS